MTDAELNLEIALRRGWKRVAWTRHLSSFPFGRMRSPEGKLYDPPLRCFTTEGEECMSLLLEVLENSEVKLGKRGDLMHMRAPGGLFFYNESFPRVIAEMWIALNPQEKTE